MYLKGTVRVNQNLNGSRTYAWMQSVNDELDAILETFMEERKCTKQELIRAVIIPDWLRAQKRPTSSVEARLQQ